MKIIYNMYDSTKACVKLNNCIIKMHYIEVKTKLVQERLQQQRQSQQEQSEVRKVSNAQGTSSGGGGNSSDRCSSSTRATCTQQ